MEAVAESFYQVEEKQEMEVGQSNSVLMNCAKVNWSLPLVIQCNYAPNEMDKLYINGDKDRGNIMFQCTGIEGHGRCKKENSLRF